MKKISLLFAGILTACFLFAEEPATARINAYGLTMEKNGDEFTFNFNANIAATDASIVLFDKDGKTVSEKEITVAAGANEFTFDSSELELEEGDSLNWGVALKAEYIKNFTKVFDEGKSVLQRKFLCLDNNPESPYFGRIYSEDRITSSDCKVKAYNPDYTVLAEKITSIGNVGRPGVDEEGFVYCADFGDATAGIQVINPADLTKSTQLFVGDKLSSGIRVTSNKEGICGSTTAADIYGSGKSTQLVVCNEDSGNGLQQANGCLVFNLGQPDGSILRSWNKVPSHQVIMSHNAGTSFSMHKTDKGIWWAQNRGAGQNLNANRSLMFYNNADELKWESTDQTLINGSNGGGMDISRDGSKIALVNGNGNILIFDVTWNEDTPTLTHDTTFTTGEAYVTSINFDYAGNLVCSAGTYIKSGANAGTMRLIVWALPTEDNSVVVPAQKSQWVTIPGIPSSFEEITSEANIQVVKRVINGQLYILRDGQMYNMQGMLVK